MHSSWKDSTSDGCLDEFKRDLRDYYSVKNIVPSYGIIG